MDHNRKALSMWDGWAMGRFGVPIYDLWLDSYKKELDKRKDHIVLDLGCGNGADTKYLVERGYTVISSDYSWEALKNVNHNIKGSMTKYADMNEPLPFSDSLFGVVIGDMSLHYLDSAKTKELMSEIARILEDDGILLARVSSMNDKAYGAGSGRRIEKRYFDHGSYAQRYFTEEDLDDFFGIIGDYSFRETAMTRDEPYYSKPKIMFEVLVQKNLRRGGYHDNTGEA